MQTKFVEAKIYKTTDSLCYVSKNEFSPGDSIVKPNSTNKYLIGPTEKLKGVYCVNTGYTSFKIIEIIDQNDEYCIVKRGGSYGISVYDRILLDSHNYTENQMIY